MTTPRIDHFAAAVQLMAESEEQWEPGSAPEAGYLAEALVHATLAVARELRAANLIHASQLRPDSQSVVGAVDEIPRHNNTTRGVE